MPEPTDERAVRAAAELFEDRAISAVGVDALAGAAGISKRTLYDRFGSKSGLVDRYLEDEDTRLRQVLGAAFLGPDDPTEQLVVFFQRIADRARRDTLRCPFIDAAIDQRGAAGLPVVRRHKRWLHHEFARRATGHPSPDELADQLLALFDGVMVAGRTGDQRRAARSAVRAVDTLVHGS